MPAPPLLSTDPLQRTIVVLESPNLGADEERAAFVVHVVIREAKRLGGRPFLLKSVTVALHGVAVTVTPPEGCALDEAVVNIARTHLGAVCARAARA